MARQIHVNVHLKSEIADICLKCSKKKCSNVKDGCAEYRAAVKEICHSTRDENRAMLITVHGEVHTYKDWADILGLTYNALYKRARRGNRTMAMQIEYEYDRQRSDEADGQDHGA